MDIRKEIKHIKGLASTLNALAKEVERRGEFLPNDLCLLKNIGSDLLFKGVTIDYRK